jgi:hypothetical protein
MVKIDQHLFDAPPCKRVDGVLQNGFAPDG